jgi:hypothetical protein
MLRTFTQRSRYWWSFARLATGAVLLTACESEAHRVCSDVTNCSHGGSDDEVTACRERADELAHVATRSGCDAAYDAYFSCASEHFECTGNASTFPGCDGAAAAFDRCIEAGRASNACGELDTRVASCPDDSAGEATNAESSLEPCTASGVCSAQCYLDSVHDVCAPAPAELAAFADCAAHCVF